MFLGEAWHSCGYYSGLVAFLITFFLILLYIRGGLGQEFGSIWIA